LCFADLFTDIYITDTHLPGAINVTADRLSHGRLSQAFQVTPTLSRQPTMIPYTANELISPSWISPYFHQQTLFLTQ